MKTQREQFLIALACLSLGACGFHGFGGHKAPTGQVVATVDGQEITLRELQAELSGVTATDPKTHKALEQQALQMIIERKLLAKAARDQGLDKTPEFALAQARATDSLLVEALETKTAATVPATTPEEAQGFVSDHPDMFAERKIFTLDSIRIARPTDPNIVKGLVPLTTLDQVVAFLNQAKIPYERSPSKLDAVGADPKLVDAIIKLPPNEVFIIPAGRLVAINQVQSVQVQPFTGDPAIQFATQFLHRQHIQETVSRQFSQMILKSAKNVSYNKAYQPVKPAAPASGAAAPGAAHPGADQDNATNAM
jgi:EpsD family peptidyl-prolyl cis-trans isomerase